MHPNPLETGEDGWQFVSTLERQANLFDGDDLQVGLGLESVAHMVDKDANVAGSDLKIPSNVQSRDQHS
jgi:hypothetical protein